MLAMQQTELPRTLKGQYVIATLERSASAVHMHLFRRTVESRVHDDGGMVSTGVIETMKIARLRGALVVKRLQ